MVEEEPRPPKVDVSKEGDIKIDAEGRRIPKPFTRGGKLITPKQGRGPKKKEKLSFEKVKSSDMAKMFDSLILDATNNTILKGKSKKLEPEKCKLGSAALYAVQYYFPVFEPDHPILVLLAAGVGYGIAVKSCMNSPPQQAART